MSCLPIAWIQPLWIRSFGVAVLVLGTLACRAGEPQSWIEQNLRSLVDLYLHLHQHPELSLHEEATAARLAEELRSAGIEVTTGIGGHGVVGILKNGAGQTVMVRTDTDALPVIEETGLVYASTVMSPDAAGGATGVMHACGHDVHMTNLVAVARYLAEHKDKWSGTVMFVCQPAEERGAGAKAMIDDGLFTRFPKPNLALALHVDSTLATGRIGYRAGYNLANVDSVDVTMIGRGGHGAYPQTTIDPIVMAAHLVLDLQSIVSRETSPTEAAVITVGAIHGGSKHNVISDRCHLLLTVRSYSDNVREHLLTAIERKAKAVAASANAPEPVVVRSEWTPAMFNDEALVERVLPSLRRAIGEQNLVLAEPSMGGEDFSQYALAGVPIFMFRLGAVDAKRLEAYARKGEQPPSLHSGKFYPDVEDALRTGIAAMTAAVMDQLPVAK